MDSILIILGAALAFAFLAAGLLLMTRSAKNGSTTLQMIDGRSLVKIQKAEGPVLVRMRGEDGSKHDFVADEGYDPYDVEIFSNSAMLDRLTDESIPVEERIKYKRSLERCGYTVKIDFGEAEKEYEDGLVEEDAEPDGAGQELPSDEDALKDIPEAEEDTLAEDEHARCVVDALRKAGLMNFVYDALMEGKILPSLAAMAESKTGLTLNEEAWKHADREEALRQLAVLEEDMQVAGRTFDETEKLIRESVEHGAAKAVGRTEAEAEEKRGRNAEQRESGAAGPELDPYEGMM